MPSLNRQRQASQLLREAAQARIAREAAAKIPPMNKPILHLFKNEAAAGTRPTTEARETRPLAPPAAVGGPPVPDSPPPLAAAPPPSYVGADGHAYPGTLSGGRFQWRCRVCGIFARQYRHDKERAKAARDYAYANRGMIGEAFDRGVVKEVVVNALRVGFDAVR